MYSSPNPLASYHNQLRVAAPSGYPNQQYSAPHPYQMAMAHQQLPSALQSWQWQQGRDMRRPQSKYGTARPNIISSFPQYGRGRSMGRKMSLYTRNRQRLYRPIRNNDARGWGTPHQYHGYGPQRIERIF